MHAWSHEYHMILNSKRAREVTQNKQHMQKQTQNLGKTKVDTLHHFAQPGPTA